MNAGQPIRGAETITCIRSRPRQNERRLDSMNQGGAYFAEKLAGQLADLANLLTHLTQTSKNNRLVYQTYSAVTVYLKEALFITRGAL